MFETNIHLQHFHCFVEGQTDCPHCVIPKRMIRIESVLCNCRPGFVPFLIFRKCLNAKRNQKELLWDSSERFYLSRVSCTLTQILFQVGHSQSKLQCSHQLFWGALGVIDLIPSRRPPPWDDPLIARTVKPHVVNLLQIQS
jgi:hypothetical protein